MVSFESAAKSSSSDDDEKKSSDSESDDADKANEDSCKNPTDEFLDICASFHYKQLSKQLTLKYTLLGGVSRSVSDLSASVECQDELCDIKFEGLKKILDEGSLFTKGFGFVPVGYSTIFPDGSKGIIYLTGQKLVEQCSSSAENLHFKNQGAYIAAFTASLKEPQETESDDEVTYKENSYECWRAAGVQCDVDVPKGSKDIKIRAEYFTGHL